MSKDTLNGIISAIEAEGVNPSPSHANLARLFAMYLKETLVQTANEVPPMQTSTENATTMIADVDVEPEEKPEKKSKRRTKNSK